MPPGRRNSRTPRRESDFVELIKRYVGDTESSTEELGIGDDAAIVDFRNDQIVLTADAMVDGVHFRSEWIADSLTTWRDVGWKCVVSNQSDIAAMGARPEHAVLTIAKTASQNTHDLEDLLAGVSDALRNFGGKLVGGDTVSSDVAMINVTMTGSLWDPPRSLRRDAAKAGDNIGVTGTVGASAGGLRLLQSDTVSGLVKVDASTQQLLDAYFRPKPRIDVASRLMESGVACAMDVSDGLLIDLERICTASGLDAEVRAEEVPLHVGTRNLFGDDVALELGLTGGEDYQILFACDDTAVMSLSAHHNEPGSDFRLIGQFVDPADDGGFVKVVNDFGEPVLTTTKGWDHFSK